MFMNKANMEYMIELKSSSYCSNSVFEYVSKFNIGEPNHHWSDCQATGWPNSQRYVTWSWKMKIFVFDVPIIEAISLNTLTCYPKTMLLPWYHDKKYSKQSDTMFFGHINHYESVQPNCSNYWYFYNSCIIQYMSKNHGFTLVPGPKNVLNTANMVIPR